MNDSKSVAPTVLSAGHINWDVTMHVRSLPDPDGEVRIRRLIQSGGGSAANVAVGLVGLDALTAVYGSVGGDDAGAMALRELDRSGVETGNVLIDDSEQTSVKYLVVDDDGEVMVLANEGANESFSASRLDAGVFDAINHVHMTSQRPETAAELAAAAGDAGVTVSFDPGRRVGGRDFEDALFESDVLFVNRREAAIVSEGSIDVDAPDRIVVVKLGADGAEVRTPAGRLSHPGFEVDVVDTTGSGDAFAAGFLATVLSERRSRDAPLPHEPTAYRRALAVGNACGALTAREPTARAAISWENVASLTGVESVRPIVDG
ncbi:MAG: carbohydrate kinase family protein [Halobacteriota archaeon]